jgi:hypothetical protein
VCEAGGGGNAGSPSLTANAAIPAANDDETSVVAEGGRADGGVNLIWV